jgi:hypothetical protein
VVERPIFLHQDHHVLDIVEAAPSPRLAEGVEQAIRQGGDRATRHHHTGRDGASGEEAAAVEVTRRSHSG